MSHVISGLRRPARLVAAVFLALVTVATVIGAVSASASSRPTPTAVVRPCPILRTIRPCPPCPFQQYPRLRPCPPVTTVPEPGPGPVVPGVFGAKDFSAFVNRQPGVTPKLIVTGTLVMGSPGYGIRLVPTDPQGVNGDILLLNLVVTPPKGFQAQVITEVTVRFETTDFTDVSEVNILELALQLPVTTAR